MRLPWGFQRRVCGRGSLIDYYYQAAEHGSGADLEPGLMPKWSTVDADGRTVQKAIEWVSSRNGDRPFFLMLQMDASHYPYQFDEEWGQDRPYASRDQVNDYTNPHYVELMHRRYTNSIRQIDHRIGDFMDALRTKGFYDRTIFVVTSDHGESFLPHRVGHGPLEENTRRIPLIIRVPNRPAREVDRLWRHQDIWPTLFAELGITGLQADWFLGRPCLDGLEDEEAALVVHGTTRMADVVTPTRVYRFRIKSNLHEITFIPLIVLDRNDQQVSCQPRQFARQLEQLRPIVERIALYQPSKATLSPQARR